MKLYYFLICFSLILAGCQKNSSSVEPAGNSAFSIYLLKDHSILLSDILDTNINDLVLADTPCIAPEDVNFYDYSCHCIYLKKNKDALLNIKADIKMNDQPFVVCANNKRCYVGTFHSSAMSSVPIKPYICEHDLMYYAPDVLHISQARNDNEDTRNNFLVANDLRKSNKLHEGLLLAIKNVTIISNHDTAVVKYSFTITNNDKDNLYILDPDKMGSELFHYFTNGIIFSSSDKMIGPDYKKTEQPEPFTNWDKEWFTKISSSSTIMRTVTLKGYPHIPAGTYNCSFTFSNPTNIDSGSRILSDGRYWIGSIQSKAVSNVVQ